MGTTLVIVEVLITGFQVLIWVGLLLSHFNAMPPCPNELNRNDTVLFAFVVGAAYTLGIVYDRVLGHLSTLSQVFIKWSWGRIKSLRLIEDRSEGYRSKMGSATFRGKTQERSPATDEKNLIDDFCTNQIFRPQAYEALENANRQIRLLRATTFNSIITAGMLFAWHRSEYQPMAISLTILGVLCLVAWLMSHSRRQTHRASVYYAAQREELAKAKHGAFARPSARPAAPSGPQAGSSPAHGLAKSVQPPLYPPNDGQRQAGPSPQRV
jgi:hypothetical protein